MSELATFPLSFAQQRLWFLHQLEPTSSAYHAPFARRLRGPLDRAALERALTAIQARHESLRTTFAVHDGEPIQVIHPETSFALVVTDLRDVPLDQREAALIRRVTAEAHRPFDLGADSVLRATLFEVADHDAVLLIVIHHIAGDGWSLGILVREASALYQAFAAGHEPNLPELPIQYADFAAWQREWLVGEELERQLAYWRTALADLPTLSMPTDRPRPRRAATSGGTVLVRLPAATAAAIRQLGRQHATSTFMVTLAAFDVLLRRYSGQDDLVIGTQIANRHRSETEPLIGFFVNTLVLRARCHGNPTFLDFLAQVRETTLAAYAHQDLPFERLVEELQPDRDPGRNPLFQVSFAGQNAPFGAFDFGPVSVELYPFAQPNTRFDLEVFVWESDGTFELQCNYNADLFDHDTAQRLMERFGHLLDAVADDPTRRIDEIPFLSPTERRQVVVEFNATAVDYPGGCLHHLVEAQVARTPDAIAVESDAGSLTYRQLDDRAATLARWLVHQGVGPDHLVAVCLDRSLEMVVALLGILKAGAAYVPVDPSYPEGRVRYMLTDAAARVVLTQAALVDRLAGLDATVVPLDTAWTRLADVPDAGPPPAPSPTDLAYVIYTSGSTGQPKGAMNEHRGIVNRLRWMQDTFQLGPDDAVLQKTPVSFDVSVWELFWPLATGARLVMARPEGHKDPDYLAQVIRERGITTLHFVPSMLRAFLAGGRARGLPSVRRVLCSGEALPLDLAQQHAADWGAPLHNLYGPTEAAVDVSWWPVDPAAGGTSVPIGKPIANTQLYVLDRRLEPVPLGVPGDLYIGGVQVGRGYWRRPELTAERFLPDPFAAAAGARLYRTGDVARWRANGALEFLGRSDHQVKLRGFRIELGEVEAALMELPGVAAAAVTVREDNPGDQRLVAYLVPTPPTAWTLDTVRRTLASSLPEFQLPSALVILEQLPLGPTGKLDRSTLPAPEINRDTLGPSYLAPRDATETALVDIWQQILKVPRVGVRENFFALGGHSLLATQLVSRARDTLAVEIPLRTVFAEPTVEGMALAVVQLRAAATDPSELDRLLNELEQSAP